MARFQSAAPGDLESGECSAGFQWLLKHLVCTVTTFDADIKPAYLLSSLVDQIHDDWILRGSSNAWLIMSSVAHAEILNEVCRLRLQQVPELPKAELWLRSISSVSHIFRGWDSEPSAEQLSAEFAVAEIYEGVLDNRFFLKSFAASCDVDILRAGSSADDYETFRQLAAQRKHLPWRRRHVFNR